MGSPFNLLNSFQVKHPDQKFEFNIFSHDTGFHKIEDYYAWIQYDVFNNSTSNVILKSKQFVSTTKEDIFQQCENWIKQNFKGDFKIIKTQH